MELSQVKNQILKLQEIKKKAVIDKDYEMAARTRDKIKQLLHSILEQMKDFNEHQLAEANQIYNEWK